MLSATKKIFVYSSKISLLRSVSRKVVRTLIKRSFRSCGILSNEVRVRFAPSPTGQLHIGGFRTALYNHLFLKSNPAGKFILRIEDTDQTRLVPGAAEQLEDLLKWAGITPDESPNQGGPYGPYKQSERLDIYHGAVQQLLDEGHAYHCFCSEKRLDLLKKEAARNRTNNKYDGRCSNLSKTDVKEKLSKGTPYTIRFKLRSNAGSDVQNNNTVNESASFVDLLFGDINQPCVFETEGDPIIIKSDGYPVYHFANVVDDHYMDITHVLRGVEWLVSTPKHLALYKAFRWKPPHYLHLPLMMNSDGTKLSKRNGKGNNNLIYVEQYRDKGYYAETLVNFLTLTGGGFRDKDFTEDRVYTLKELRSRFDYKLLKTHSSKIEFERLETLNRKYLHESLNNTETFQTSLQKSNSSNRQLLDILIEAKGHINSVSNGRILDLDDPTLLKRLRWLVSEGRVNKLSDISNSKDLHFLWFEPDMCDSYGDKVNSTILNEVISVLQSCNSEENLFPSDVSNKVRSVAKNHKKDGLKVSELMAGIRLALSGVREGPPVGEMLENLGLEKAINRLRKASLSLKSN